MENKTQLILIEKSHNNKLILASIVNSDRIVATTLNISQLFDFVLFMSFYLFLRGSGGAQRES